MYNKGILSIMPSVSSNARTASDAGKINQSPEVPALSSLNAEPNAAEAQ
jgi:hypothetical protein